MLRAILQRLTRLLNPPPVLLFVLLACTSKGMGQMSKESPSTKVAVEFATSVAAGEQARAHALLSSKLRSTLTPEQLQTQYGEMVSYGSGAPTTIAVMTTMETWPDKQPSDTQWVYVAIANDTYSEAVTVVVADEESRLVIRSIEWGRP
jgi:phage repressor protein C with HTH and peptisase S24 domain